MAQSRKWPSEDATNLARARNTEHGEKESEHLFCANKKHIGLCVFLFLYAHVAQLVERILGKDKVSGSIPDVGSEGNKF